MGMQMLYQLVMVQVMQILQFIILQIGDIIVRSISPETYQSMFHLKILLFGIVKKRVNVTLNEHFQISKVVGRVLVI